MTSSDDLSDLVALGRSRWMVPLLADLAGHGGARFVELVQRLGISRDSLSRTLELARRAGWVMANPGHGHPLRPEHVLTAEGARLARRAAAIMAATAAATHPPEAFTRWSLPIVHVVHGGCSRFNEIARLLDPATPRAVSQGLAALRGRQLVARTVIDASPPAALYTLTPQGRALAEAIRPGRQTTNLSGQARP